VRDSFFSVETLVDVGRVSVAVVAEEGMLGVICSSYAYLVRSRQSTASMDFLRLREERRGRERHVPPHLLGAARHETLFVVYRMDIHE
jgi:hypothetical protein